MMLSALPMTTINSGEGEGLQLPRRIKDRTSFMLKGPLQVFDWHQLGLVTINSKQFHTIWPFAFVSLFIHFIVHHMAAIRSHFRYISGNTASFIRPIQRRWAQVHDVRFLVTHQRSDSIAEKYHAKLQKKARQ